HCWRILFQTAVYRIEACLPRVPKRDVTCALEMLRFNSGVNLSLLLVDCPPRLAFQDQRMVTLVTESYQICLDYPDFRHRNRLFDHHQTISEFIKSRQPLSVALQKADYSVNGDEIALQVKASLSSVTQPQRLSPVIILSK